MTTNKTKQNLKKIKNFDNFIDLIFTLAIFLIMLIIIANPTKYTTGTISGLKLFFFNVLPGLFPFMFLTKLITELNQVFIISQKLDKFSYKLFGTPGVSIYALFMSIISGYPIGAKIIADLYSKNQITEAEAKKMSIFCTTSGPIFVIGTVGTIMFQNYKFGIIIYLSHIISSILLGIAYNLISKSSKNKKLKTAETTQQIVIKQKQLPTKQKNLINLCLNQTINSLFIVGAYITIFYLTSEILETLHIFEFLSNILFKLFSKLNFNKIQTSGFIYGLLEVTRGSKILSTISIKSSAVLTSGLISFSGLSIIMQSMAFLKDAKIKTHTFIISKCVHSIFSMLICALFFIFI